MCIIFHCFKNRPDDDLLKRADIKNPDGIGIAWKIKKRSGEELIQWEKGLNLEQLLDKLHNSPPEFPYVIHFRSATPGIPVCKELTHPFVASPAASNALKGQAPTVIFHNGRWDQWKYTTFSIFKSIAKKIPKGPWSDSRAIALHFGVFGSAVMDFEDFGGTQRIFMFSATREGSWKWGKWTTADGYEHSNPTHAHDGEINVASPKELKKLEKQEKKAERKKSSPGTTSNCMLIISFKPFI